MKTAVLPSFQVEHDLLDALESVLNDGETVAAFVDAAVRASVDRRHPMHAKVIARGLRSRDEGRRKGEYVDADIVIEGLQCKLDAARAWKASLSK